MVKFHRDIFLMIKFKSKNLVLLTGAGFTKNFGGFLGSEMWAQIFNDEEIQSHDSLRELLQEDYDFESVYSSVMNGSLPEADKIVMRKVIERAYRNLDNAIKGWVFNHDSPYPVNWYGWGKLTNLFVGLGDEKGLFFTLNQDIFIERKSGHRPPGAPFFRDELYYGLGGEFAPDQFVTLPNEDVITKAEKDFMSHAGLAYVKLHGSYGWRSSDGSNQMVIGKNKSELIEKEPLLKWYFELFQTVISEGNKKILIVGYGFGDQHINSVLLDGVNNHGLQIYIISKKQPAEFKRQFERGGHYYALPILKGLRGYFPYELKEIFPGNQEETVHFKRIQESLLRTT